ncbi:MAG TPA: ferredoxin family protein [Cellulomonas sp.]
MSQLEPITVNVDEYLGRNKYQVDEGNPHIEIVDHAEPEAFLRLVRACPAALYKVDASGNQTFDYAGCLECGTCRILGTGNVVVRWTYPGPTMGVEYRYG